MAHDVFISYSSTDKAVADAACATLEKRRIRCWVAPRDVPAGVSWASSLVEAIGGSRVVVLILSKGSNSSPQVIREVDEAVGTGIPVVPLRIDDVEPSDQMRFYIKSVHWLDALSPPMEEHLKRLADSVEALLAVGDDRRPPLGEQPGDRPTTPRAVSAQSLETGRVVDAVVTKTSMDMATLSLPDGNIGKIILPDYRLLLVFKPFKWLSRKYTVGGRLTVRIKRQMRTGNYSCEPYIDPTA